MVDFRTACKNQSVLSTNPFYPDSVWDGWINEACCDLSSFGIIEKLDTIEWIAGTMVYDLNDDFITYVSIFALYPTGKLALDFILATDVGKVEDLSDQPIQVWQSGKGENAIVGFFPLPTIKDTLLVIYGASAEYMDSDNDITDIPYSYRPLIIDYVVYRALLRDGKRTSSDRYYESYMRRLEVKLKFDLKRFDVFVAPKEIK